MPTNLGLSRVRHAQPFQNYLLDFYDHAYKAQRDPKLFCYVFFKTTSALDKLYDLNVCKNKVYVHVYSKQQIYKNIYYIHTDLSKSKSTINFLLLIIYQI